MKIFKTKAQYFDWRKAQNPKLTIGFVPTMGALHLGHLSLIDKSKSASNLTTCSIFVNPTQFNNLLDFEKYPKTISQDLKLLEEVGCDVVFLPEVSEMYQENETVEQFDFSPFDTSMEGRFRPGHFNGVGTIVSKLFDIIKPQMAFFGEKDFQQLKVIEKLVSLKSLPVEIVGCPILRESDGLAMSSRNTRLTEIERKKAVFIYEVLNFAKSMIASKTSEEIKFLVQEAFKKEPAFELDYFEIASEHDLQPTKNLNSENKPRAFIAAFLGGVRLIDNLALIS